MYKYQHLIYEALTYDWWDLCLNPKAIPVISEHPEKIDWRNLSTLQEAEGVLRQHGKFINPRVITDEAYIREHMNDPDFCWIWFSMNPSPAAMKVLKENINRVSSYGICYNPNPEAIEILTNHPDKICWTSLSSNPNAIELLSNNIDKINWVYLCINPKAEKLISDNIYEIKQAGFLTWSFMSSNPGAVSILKQNMEYIDWRELCHNKNPDAIELIRQNLHRPDISWSNLSRNPAAVELLIEHPHMISWEDILQNPNPAVMPLIDKRYNMGKRWCMASLGANPSLFELV
jgi:hypothetical protein